MRVVTLTLCSEGSMVTCLHSLGPLIRVPLTPPPLHSRLALTFTIEQPPPFPINSLRAPYLDTVPYQSRLSDVILQSYSVRVRFRSAFPCLVPCSAPPEPPLFHFPLVRSVTPSLDRLPLGFLPTLALSSQRIVPLQLHGSDDP